jgi:hypothetical protein
MGHDVLSYNRTPYPYRRTVRRPIGHNGAIERACSHYTARTTGPFQSLQTNAHTAGQTANPNEAANVPTADAVLSAQPYERAHGDSERKDDTFTLPYVHASSAVDSTYRTIGQPTRTSAANIRTNGDECTRTQAERANGRTSGQSSGRTSNHSSCLSYGHTRGLHERSNARVCSSIRTPNRASNRTTDRQSRRTSNRATLPYNR